MNQSIIFPDLQDWDEVNQEVIFPAQCQGANIRCRISRVRLMAILHQLDEPELEPELNEPDIHKLGQLLLADEIIAGFERCRFDIEDLVEALNEDEAFDEDGGISLL